MKTIKITNETHRQLQLIKAHRGYLSIEDAIKECLKECKVVEELSKIIGKKTHNL